MRISKRNLAIDQADDNEDTFRPVLATIHFEREGSVSADGIRLAFVPYPEPCAEDDPAIGTMMPIDIARRAAKVARWRDVIDLERDGDRFTIVIRQRDYDDSVPVEVRISGAPSTAGKFPKWRDLVPPDAKAEALVNPEYLIDACKQLHDAGYHSVRLKVPGDEKWPVVVEGSDDHTDGPAPMLLVMRMKQLAPGERLRDVSSGKAAG